MHLFKLLLVALAISSAVWFGISRNDHSPIVRLSGGEAADRIQATLTPAQPLAGEETVLTFTVTRPDGEASTELHTHHTRRMHVVIVNESRTMFAHIHPEDFPELNRDLPTGSYAIQFPFPEAERYLVSVDAMDAAGALRTAFHVRVDGEPATATRIRHTSLDACLSAHAEQGVDRNIRPVALSTASGCTSGYTLTLSPPAELLAGIPTRFAFDVKKDGVPVTDLSPMMAAGVHFAIIPDSFDSLIHTHGGPADTHTHTEARAHDTALPPRFGPSLISEAVTFPQKGNYTLIAQLKHGSTILVGAFDLTVLPSEAHALGKTHMFPIHIEDNAVHGETIWRIAQGDTAMFHVMSDAPEELHVHGYDASVSFAKGVETTLSVYGETTGRFPVELEGARREIGILEVLPR